MKPWTTWLARLGIAGACFIVAGCGGGDVPDASSDGQATTAGASTEPSQVPAATAGAKIAANDEQAPKADEAAAEPSAPAQAPEPESPPANAKKEEGKASSKTAEMLAMATGPSGGGSDTPADGSTPPPANTPAPGESGANSNPEGSGGQAGPGGAPAPGPGRPGMGPQQGQQGQQAQQAQEAQRRGMADMAARAQSQNQGNQAAAMAGRMGGRGGPGAPGGPGGPGAPGGAGVDNSPADFHSPTGAVRAFLSALRAKDLDRLNEATALRAQVEASTKNQELFKKIFDLSLSDSDLDDLAKKLEGYQVAFENPAQSTGRIDVILQKQDRNSNGSYFRRKVTVRHEKKGWGVLDIAGAQEFKPLNVMPRRNTGGSGRRGS
jgi:hypothetical protein